MTHYSNEEENFNKEDSQEYETSDFYQASFLKSIGYALAGLRKSGKRTVFRFVDKPSRESDLLSYFNREDKIAAQTLISSIREMKALIHNN